MAGIKCGHLYATRLRLKREKKREDFAATLASRRYMGTLTEELGNNAPAVLINLIAIFAAHSSLLDLLRYELQTAFEMWRKSNKHLQINKFLKY